MKKIFIMDLEPLCSDSLYQGLYLKTNKYFKDKIDRKKLRADKIRTLAGAYLLSKGLRELGFDPENVKLKDSEKGKPQIDGAFFNISHSENMAVCAFGDSEIGVDIEKIKPMSDRILDKIALPSERAKISAAKQIIRLWTRKEALAKCLGTGLGYGVFKTDLSEEQIRYDGETYRLKSFEFEDYMISVCTEFDFPPEKLTKVNILK